jgi:hydroxypyruvate isomerase
MPTVVNMTMDELVRERKLLSGKLRKINKAIDQKHTQLRKEYETQAKDNRAVLKAVRSTLTRSMNTVRQSIKASTLRIKVEPFNKTPLPNYTISLHVYICT